MTGTAGECVASGDEEQALEGLTLEDMNVVAAFTATPRSSTWLSLELAVNEWNEARRVNESTLPRPLVLLLCDDAEQSVSDAVPRIVAELGVHALLAPAGEAPLRALLEPIGTSPPVLVLSAYGSSLGTPSAGSGADVWFLGASYSATLPAYEQTLRRALVSARGRAAEGMAFQLASVVGEGPEDEALWNSVRARVEVDGRDAGGLVIDDRLRIIHPPWERRFDPTQGLERLLDPVPQLVLLFMGPREDPARLDAATIIQLVEASAAARGAVPPLYVLGPRSLQDAALHSFVAGRPSLRSRVIGVRADASPDARLGDELQARFVAAYPAAAASANMSRSNASAYDALYLLAFASFVAEQVGDAQGVRDVRDGFLRVSAGKLGEPIDVGPGPEQLSRGLQLLAAGADLQLKGASGPVQFDGEHTRAGTPRPYIVGADGQLLDVDPSTVFDAAAETSD